LVGSDRLIKQKQVDDILSLLALQWASSLVFQSSIFPKNEKTPEILQRGSGRRVTLGT